MYGSQKDREEGISLALLCADEMACQFDGLVFGGMTPKLPMGGFFCANSSQIAERDGMTLRSASGLGLSCTGVRLEGAC